MGAEETITAQNSWSRWYFVTFGGYLLIAPLQDDITAENTLLNYSCEEPGMQVKTIAGLKKTTSGEAVQEAF